MLPALLLLSVSMGAPAQAASSCPQAASSGLRAEFMGAQASGPRAASSGPRAEFMGAQASGPQAAPSGPRAEFMGAQASGPQAASSGPRADSVAVDPTFPGGRARGLSAQPAARFTPSGFLQMFVAGVMPTPDGHTLVLVNPDEEVLLPVGVGLPEAVSIYGRLEHKTAPQPLTHDLLDNVVEALGAEVIRVQIDDLKDVVFIGSVFLRGRDGKELVALDARASDAVAIALSAHAPIFVARSVVERAALTADDLENLPSPSEPPHAAARTFEL